MQHSVLNESTINTNKIIYGSVQATEDNKFLAAKIWYQFGKISATLFTQTRKMSIYEIRPNGDVILCFDSITDSELYEKCNQKTVEFIKSSGIIQKYKLKNIKLKSIVNELAGLSVIRLPPNSQSIFYNPDKQQISPNELSKFMQPGEHVKVILEHHSIIVDVDKSEVATNILVRQVRFYKHPPKTIELSEYSFIDSDSDNENHIISSELAKRVVRTVTYTECPNDETSDFEFTKTCNSDKKVVNNGNDNHNHNDNDNDNDDNCSDGNDNGDDYNDDDECNGNINDDEYDEYNNGCDNEDDSSDGGINLATSDNESEISVDTTTFISQMSKRMEK